MNGKIVALMLLGLALGGPLRAADSDDPAKQGVKTPPADTDNKGSANEASKLAAKFNVPQQEILDLRAKGMGWGEINHALAISQKANVPLADVVKLRDSGMGWGRIAKKYGFTLGDVTGKVRGGRDRDDKIRHSDMHERHQGLHGFGGGRGH